jgi:hypothetical protein
MPAVKMWQQPCDRRNAQRMADLYERIVKKYLEIIPVDHSGVSVNGVLLILQRTADGVQTLLSVSGPLTGTASIPMPVSHAVWERKTQ